MDEYVNKEAFIKRFEGMNVSWVMTMLDIFREFPAADVAPVRHGQWVTNSDRPDSLICSVCNCGFDMWKHDPHNYCPNCGAKMDLEE